MNNRIKILRTELGLSQAEFGQKLGVTKAAISRLEHGVNNVTEQMTKSICREFGVNHLWLTTGDGEMFNQSEDGTIKQIDNILYGESDFAKMVFKAFAKFDNEDWLKVEQLVKKLLLDVDIEDITHLLSKSENENE